MNHFKKLVCRAALLITVFIGLSSCMNNKPADTKEIAEDKNEEKFENNNNKKDAQFLVNAAEINREEISLGQLAQQKSNISHVKELGKMMEDEHTRSLAALTELAYSKNISLPTSQTENGQIAYKKLNETSGSDFGKEYSDLMVSAHKDAIALFEKASTECTDPDIRVWASTMIPSLRTHLDHSLMCQKECEKI